MDDPVFEPWSLEETPEGAAPQVRWRSRRAGAPPPMRPQTSPSPSVHRPRVTTPTARLAGTRGFLRSMAVPRLQEATQRLSMARHDVRLEDLLDSSPPLIRVALKPWRGPLADADDPGGVFELSIDYGPEEHAVAHSKLLGPGGPMSREERVPTRKLGGEWIDARVLDFIGLVLDRV